MYISKGSNTNNQTIVLIMAGGIGERFWPLSTPSKPKQLLPFGKSGKTLIEDTIDRVQPLVVQDNIWIATSESLKPIFSQLKLCPESQILAEPFRRNTAGCLAFAVSHLLVKYGNEVNNYVMAVLTADHIIEPKEKFIETFKVITDFVSSNPMLGVMGIQPTRPETGYGYIESGEEISQGIHKVVRFHEKPNLEKANEYLTKGNYFWNSGMFFWKIETFLNELKSASPVHYESIFKLRDAILENNIEKLREVFKSLPDISIDYALMERSSNIAMVKAEFFWDDLGSWTSLERIFIPDENGNIVQGKWIGIETSNCIIYNAGENEPTVATLGINNIVVAVVGNIILIMNKNESQKLKTLLSKYNEMK